MARLAGYAYEETAATFARLTGGLESSGTKKSGEVDGRIDAITIELPDAVFEHRRFLFEPALQALQ